MSQHVWSPNSERVPGSESTMWVRLQRLLFGVPVYNPRVKANWHHGQSVTRLQAWLPFNAVCFCLVKLGMWLSLGLGWPGPPPGAQPSQDFSPILSMVLLTAGSPSQSLPVRAMSRQVRSKVRGCSALSVKPKQDYSLHFPKSPQDCLGWRTQKQGKVTQAVILIL